MSKILWHDRSYHLRLPHDVGPARDFLGEAEKTPWLRCGLGPASRVNYKYKSWATHCARAAAKPNALFAFENETDIIE